MSITLIVSRMFDENCNDTGEEIHQKAWNELVQSHESYRFRTEPYFARNPATGETIEIAVPEGATEVLIEKDWHPFLVYRCGELCMPYSPELENPDDPTRKAVADVAGHFGALVRHDAGDEILKW